MSTREMVHVRSNAELMLHGDLTVTPFYGDKHTILVLECESTAGKFDSDRVYAQSKLELWFDHTDNAALSMARIDAMLAVLNEIRQDFTAKALGVRGAARPGDRAQSVHTADFEPEPEPELEAVTETMPKPTIVPVPR